MFTGRRYDAESGLYYYRARMYSPTLGRFLQTDPIGYWDSTNLYTYCGNNPTSFADPFGLMTAAGAARAMVTMRNAIQDTLCKGEEPLGLKSKDVNPWGTHPLDGSPGLLKEFTYLFHQGEHLASSISWAAEYYATALLDKGLDLGCAALNDLSNIPPITFGIPTPYGPYGPYTVDFQMLSTFSDAIHHFVDEPLENHAYGSWEAIQYNLDEGEWPIDIDNIRLPD